MTLVDADAMAAASRLTSSARLAKPISIDRLQGGMNNRVFRVGLDNGGAVVLKSYFSDARDLRDRLAAEWGFITFARTRGIMNVPLPLAQDIKSATALYNFIPGRKLEPREIGGAQVDAAIAFVCALNASSDLAALVPASEACFSLSDHLHTVNRRIARLGALDLNAPHRADAERFIQSDLAPAWKRVRNDVLRAAELSGLSLDAALGASETCASPSDFGFHNAIVGPEGAPTFIDFEYAGRDDPAKLSCDFFCQPEIPVPVSFFDLFVERLLSALEMSDHHYQRIRMLLDLYRIKWTCIILNEFLDLGAARRAFANKEASEERLFIQLQKARAKLLELGAH